MTIRLQVDLLPAERIEVWDDHKYYGVDEETGDLFGTQSPCNPCQFPDPNAAGPVSLNAEWILVTGEKVRIVLVSSKSSREPTAFIPRVIIRWDAEISEFDDVLEEDDPRREAAFNGNIVHHGLRSDSESRVRESLEALEATSVSLLASAGSHTRSSPASLHADHVLTLEM